MNPAPAAQLLSQIGHTGVPCLHCANRSGEFKLFVRCVNRGHLRAKSAPELRRENVPARQNRKCQL